MEILITVIGMLLAGVVILIAFFVHDALTRRGEVSLGDTGEGGRKRNTRVLWGLIFLAIAYSGLLRFLHTLTGFPFLDGIIGVVLGLFICAHPAANAVNLLFFERDSLRQTSEWSMVRWLALNLLVLLAGWMVVFVGLRRLFDPTV